MSYTKRRKKRKEFRLLHKSIVLAGTHRSVMSHRRDRLVYTLIKAEKDESYITKRKLVWCLN